MAPVPDTESSDEQLVVEQQERRRQQRASTGVLAIVSTVLPAGLLLVLIGTFGNLLFSKPFHLLATFKPFLEFVSDLFLFADRLTSCSGGAYGY